MSSIQALQMICRKRVAQCGVLWKATGVQSAVVSVPVSVPAFGRSPEMSRFTRGGFGDYAQPAVRTVVDMKTSRPYGGLG